MRVSNLMTIFEKTNKLKAHILKIKINLFLIWTSDLKFKPFVNYSLTMVLFLLCIHAQRIQFVYKPDFINIQSF